MSLTEGYVSFGQLSGLPVQACTGLFIMRSPAPFWDIGLAHWEAQFTGTRSASARHGRHLRPGLAHEPGHLADSGQARSHAAGAGFQMATEMVPRDSELTTEWNETHLTGRPPHLVRVCHHFVMSQGLLRAETQPHGGRT